MKIIFQAIGILIFLFLNIFYTSAIATESCYIGSDSTDELILVVDRTDGTTASVVGSFGVPNIEAMAKDPLTGELYAANANQLGIINLDTGAFTATASTFGTALASNGDLLADVVLADVDSLAFDPTTGFLYGVQNVAGDEILFRIDPATGALVSGAFGGDDYLLVSGVTAFDDLAIDNAGVMYASSASSLYIIDFSATGTIAAVFVGSFDGPTDMEGLSTDVPGLLIGSTGASNADPADNNSLWFVDKADGEASGQVAIPIGGDFEGITCFITEADLELSKSVVLTNDADGSTDITPGDTITYTITVTNNDLIQLASSVLVTDNLFSLVGLNFVSFTTTKPNPGAPFPNPEYDSATGVWTVGTIPASTSYDLNLVYTVTPAAASSSIANTAEVTQSANQDPDSTPGNDDGDQSEDDEDNATIVVGAVPAFADLSLTKSVAPTNPNVGDTVTFTITVANDAASTAAATGVSVQDVVPVGYNNISNITAGGSASGNIISWSGLSIPISNSVVLSFEADVTAAGAYINTAQVIASDQADLDSSPNNDDGDQSEDDEDNASVSPPPGVPVCPSGTVLTSQSGNADSAVGAGPTQNPANATGTILAAGTTANNTNSARVRNSSSSTLTLDLSDTIPANGIVVISIARDNNGGSALIEDSSDGVTYFGGQTFNSGPNDALQHINYSVSDPDGAQFLRISRTGGRVWVDGVEYSQICDAPDVADLLITKDDSSLTYTPGGTGTYTIIVTNNGPDDVVGATITDNLPNGVTLSGSWACVASAGSSCSAASGGSAGNSNVSLTADILNGGAITLNVPVNFSSNMADY